VRRKQADLVAVGAAHRAISYFHWYAADIAAAERQDEAARAVLDGAGDRGELGYALANRSFLAAQRGNAAEAIRSGTEAQSIADELDDEALHGTAAIGIALAHLAGGDVGGRAELFAARQVGLRQRIDELATSPMSHLAHVDVEQGRLAEADEVLDDALRFSEERGIPICSMWQRGVRARLRLLTGRWAEAEDDARAVLAAGHIPLGRLWPHLVLGLLAARREAPSANPHLDEAWRIALRLDVTDKLAAAAAGLAEQAWITRRPDPRLDGPLVPGLVAWSAGRADTAGSLGRWSHRLAAAGLQQPGPDLPPVPVADGQPYERALALWDTGTADDLLAALPLLDELGARAVATLVRARLREQGVQAVPRGPSVVTRTNPAGLTARQLDVLALLVDGLSNADIATRLVISRKTADHHVSAILAKLAVRSRGEAVAAARRLGV
jgi:ATP/maltotriose-dependent transcriptional regulator MalT